MEIQGNLLTTNQGTYRIIHHICPQTSQHSIVAFTDEFATFALEALSAGQSLKDEFKFTPLPGFTEYQPYFACLGAYKGDRHVGFWDIPVISATNTPITSAQFGKSSYSQLCNLALAEGTILSHRLKTKMLNNQPSSDFREHLGDDSDLGDAFDLAPSLILDAPLPARKLGKLAATTLNIVPGIESLEQGNVQAKEHEELTEASTASPLAEAIEPIKKGQGELDLNLPQPLPPKRFTGGTKLTRLQL